MPTKAKPAAAPETTPDISAGLVEKGSLPALVAQLKHDHPKLEGIREADIAAYYLQKHPEEREKLNPRAQALMNGANSPAGIQKFYAEFGEKVPSVSLEDVPEFLKPALRKAGTRVVIGNPFKEDVAHTSATDTGYIWEDRPTLVNQGVLSHEATHIFQNSLKEPPPYTDALKNLNVYNYGGWQGLIDARKQGKTINDFNEEAQAQMVEDYRDLQERLTAPVPADGKAWSSEPQVIQQENRRQMLREWDQANQALGPYIHQLAGMPLKDDTSTTINTAPPPPAPPPAALTGIAKPLPEVGGAAIDLSGGFVPKGGRQ